MSSKDAAVATIKSSSERVDLASLSDLALVLVSLVTIMVEVCAVPGKFYTELKYISTFDVLLIVATGAFSLIYAFAALGRMNPTAKLSRRDS